MHRSVDNVTYDHLTMMVTWRTQNSTPRNMTTEKLTSLNIMYSMTLPVPKVPTLVSVRHAIDAMNVSL